SDALGRRRIYNDFPVGGHVRVSAPVVRILRVDVSLGPRYTPGQTARVSIATDARHLDLDVLSFRNWSGTQDAKTTARPMAPPVSRGAFAISTPRSSAGSARAGTWTSCRTWTTRTSRTATCLPVTTT